MLDRKINQSVRSGEVFLLLGTLVMVFVYLLLAAAYDFRFWLQGLTSLVAVAVMIILTTSLKRRRGTSLSRESTESNTDGRSEQHLLRFRSLWGRNPVYTSAGVSMALFVGVGLYWGFVTWIGAANTAFGAMVLTIALAGARLQWISR